MASKKNGKAKKEVDLRKVPKDKRPKPSTGQSAEPQQIEFLELNKLEQRVVEHLNGDGNGRRETSHIKDIAKALRTDKLYIRNSMRKLVVGSWVENVKEVLTDDGEVNDKARGYYRVTENARRRLKRAEG